MHSVKPGRSSRAPDMTSWNILPAPAAVSASVCCSRVCPMVETRAYPITVEAVVDAGAVLTTSVYHKYRSGMFPNSDYRDILSGQHVVGKHNCVDGTEACPGTDLFRYSHPQWSRRLQQVREYTENVRGCLAVWHLGEGLGQAANDRGHFPPFLRVEARQLVEQGRRRQFLRVGHDPSLASVDSDNPLSMTHARRPGRGHVIASAHFMPNGSVRPGMIFTLIGCPHPGRAAG